MKTIAPLLVFAYDSLTADALKLKVPAFANAETHIGSDGAADALKGRTVLANNLFDNLKPHCDTLVDVECRMKPATRLKLDAIELADEMNFVNVYKVEKLELAEQRKLWEAQAATEKAEAKA